MATRLAERAGAFGPIRLAGMAGISLGVFMLLSGCRRHDTQPTRHATAEPPTAAQCPAEPAVGTAAATGATAGSRAATAAGTAATAAAELALRNTVPLGRAAQFRGLRSFDQAVPGRWAVCGQVSPFADDPALFVPFVAVLTVASDGRAQAPDLLFAGTTVDGADRTWAALITHCYDHGGPQPEPVRSVPPLPPLPNTIPAPPAPSTSSATAGAGAMPPGPVMTGATGTVTQGIGDPGTAGNRLVTGPTAVPGQQAAGGEAVTRQNVNLHADPHGSVTRVVPQGTALHVFATAPGGWLQVGDTAPWGWIHGSMLDQH